MLIVRVYSDYNSPMLLSSTLLRFSPPPTTTKKNRSQTKLPEASVFIRSPCPIIHPFPALLQPRSCWATCRRRAPDRNLAK